MCALDRAFLRELEVHHVSEVSDLALRVREDQLVAMEDGHLATLGQPNAIQKAAVRGGVQDVQRALLRVQFQLRMASRDQRAFQNEVALRSYSDTWPAGVQLEGALVQVRGSRG